ncbi:MAG: hypothetical protein V1904_07380 [Bacteroidota bacterium]
MKTKTRYVTFTLILLLLAVSAILLINKVINSQKKLNQAADIIESLGQTSFTIDADIHDSIDIATTFRIPASIPVHVLMNITVDAPLNINVPVTKFIQIPYSVRINEIMPVDTFFNFPEGINAAVNDTIPIDDRMRIQFWPGIQIPFVIKGTMPLNQTLSLNPGKMRVACEIPVHLLLNDTIPVYLDFTVPVKDTIPMNLLIDADALITFYTSLPVEGRLPLQLNTPVKIDFSKTPLKAKFDSLANVMRKIL